MEDGGFAENAELARMASGQAGLAVDFARDQLGLRLDWSDRSVFVVELILEVLHEQMAEAQPSEEQLQTFAELFGCYVGEVFRRNHGAQWGTLAVEGRPQPCLQTERDATCCWPWARARKRIENGREDSMFDYYRHLVRRNGRGPVPDELTVAELEALREPAQPS